MALYEKFNSLDPTPLELQESIEMIRAIQHGYKVKMVPTTHPVKSVDSENDRKIVEKLMHNDKLYYQYKWWLNKLKENLKKKFKLTWSSIPSLNVIDVLGVTKLNFVIIDMEHGSINW